MTLRLLDLDPATRVDMLREIDADRSAGRLYLSPRLSPMGRADYPDLLREAATEHDEVWLSAQLRARGRLQTRELTHTRSGAAITKRVPADAADMLAEGEFNRFFIRGLCCRAIVAGATIEVYRAKDVRRPRTASTALIGRRLDPGSLLEDLRTNVAVDTAFGLPAGPNSGLSGRLVTAA